MLARRQVYPSSPAQTRRAGPHSPVSGNHSATVRTRRGDTDLLRVALWLAKRGWHVFPLRSGGKVPAIPSAHPDGDRCRGECGQHGHGVHDATTDPDVIRMWWARWPDANVGISCGPSGLLVVDVDAHGGTPPDKPLPRHPHVDNTGVVNGYDVLAALLAVHGATWPDTLQVGTPSGGMHLYFRQPSGARLGNTTGERGRGLGWAVDTRGWGGYVVAPSSVTPAGAYVRVSATVEPAPMPPWLLMELSPPQPKTPQLDRWRLPTVMGSAYVRRAVAEELRAVAETAAGGRNDRLNVAAFNLGTLVGAGELDEAAVTEALVQAVSACGLVADDGEQSVRATIRSGLTAGARHPRVGRSAR